MLLWLLICINLWAHVPIVNSFRGIFKPKALSIRSGASAFAKQYIEAPKSLRSSALYFRVEGRQPEAEQSIALLEPEEDDEEENNDEDDDGNKISLLDSKASRFRRLSRGLVPLAASVGFAISPSSTVVGRIATAAVGGVAGFVARRALLGQMEEKKRVDSGGLSRRLLAAIEKLSDLEVIAMDAKSIKRVAAGYKIPEKELGTFFAHVVAEAVYQATSVDSMDLTELSEVLDFVNRVGFYEDEVGNGLTLAALRIAEMLDVDERGFYLQDDFPMDIYLQAAKIFFLADKLTGTTKGFYGKRLEVALSFATYDEYQETISIACRALFRRCIESVLSNPSSYSNEEVDALRSFLATSSGDVSSLRPADMQNMILEAIQLLLDSQVKDVNPLTASVDNMKKLQQAQNVLGWDSRELVATIETRTMPVFEQAASSLLNSVAEKPEKANELGEALVDRIKALNVDENKARIVMSKLVSQMNTDYMTKLDKVYNVSNGELEPVYKIMVAYTHTHEALNKFAGHVLKNNKLPLPGLPFAEMVRADLYETQLKNVNGPKVNKEMFSLTDEQIALVKKHMALPKITSWIAQCITENNFNDFAKQAYKKILGEHHIEDSDWQATAIDFYYQEVDKVSTSRAVPTMDDMTRLASMRTFLDCNEESVKRVHLELFGEKYVKALTEAMTPTGVITDEYVPGLERLRDRLGLSESDAEVLLGVAARQRLGPIIKDVADVWKSDTDAKYRREKEKKEGKSKAEKMRDPISSVDNVFGYVEMGALKESGGPNTYMREVLNLVDFVTENYLKQGIDIAQRDNFPITAVGFTTEEELMGMFKHFLISKVAETDATFRDRYDEAEDIYARILGISAENQAKIKESLSFTAYKNLLKNVLLSKERVDPQDIQQFALLKDSFRLEKEKADKIFLDASKGALLDHASRFLEDDEVELMTPVRARTYRQQVQSLGLDMQKDMGLSTSILALMFALEVQYAAENAMADELVEIHEAYDIPEERAAVIVEAVCTRYVDQLISIALRAAKKYDEKEALSYLKEIIKYLDYVTTPVLANGIMFSEEDKKRLISFYLDEIESSIEMAKEKGDDVEALMEMKDHNVQRLKEVINLSKSYQPPISGIEGLLGIKPKGKSDKLVI